MELMKEAEDRSADIESRQANGKVQNHCQTIVWQTAQSSSLAEV